MHYMIIGFDIIACYCGYDYGQKPLWMEPFLHMNTNVCLSGYMVSTEKLLRTFKVYKCLADAKVASQVLSEGTSGCDGKHNL